ncbi:MAG: DUF559 domain-containing protein [Sciscionella sp.]
MPELASSREPLNVRAPFTTQAALAAGISRSTLAGPTYRCLLRGIYILASMPADPEQHIRAALLAHPEGAFASHQSAARIWRLPIPHTAEEHVTVIGRRHRRSRPGVTSHLAPPNWPITQVRGIPVSSPEALFVELAGELGLVDLVVVGDALVKRGLVTVEQLRKFTAASRERHAIAARRAADYVRAEVDSPQETRVRMLLVLAGLPEPSINVKIYDVGGHLLYRYDLGYIEVKIAIEYDGSQHRLDLDQWEHDVDRDEWSLDNGWRVIRIFSRGIFRTPDKTIARVQKALLAAGVAGVPKRTSDAWRAYFPMR